VNFGNTIDREAAKSLRAAGDFSTSTGSRRRKNEQPASADLVRPINDALASSRASRRARREVRYLSKEENSQPKSYLLDGTPSRSAPLSRAFYKSQLALMLTIANLFLKHCSSHVLFITLTFADNVDSTREGSRRLNSFLNDIRERYCKYIWVLEPQVNGAIHYHMLVPVDFDAHDGTDLTAWSERFLHTDTQRYTAMNTRLRAESDWWETKAPLFGFGRVQVAPVYSNGEGVGKYLSKQDWRSWHWPFKETKSVRFWSCSRSARAGTVQFSWNSRGGQLCRARLAEWARQNGCNTYGELADKIGSHWGYRFHCYLTQLPDEASRL
jgi:hypothetical protein